MTGHELRDAVRELRLSQADFARLVGVSVGAVSQWLSGARSIPGTVEAFISLFFRLPISIREQELALLKKGTETMRNGMYKIRFYGSDGDGDATLSLVDGVVYGFDTSGALYDGTIALEADGNGVAIIDIKVRMPPNVKSVVGGVSYPVAWTLPVSAKLSLLHDTGYAIVKTGLGEAVQATFDRIRDIPMAA